MSPRGEGWPWQPRRGLRNLEGRRDGVTSGTSHGPIFKELAREEMTVSENHLEVRSLTRDRKGLSELQNQPSPRDLRAVHWPGTSHLRVSVSSFRWDKRHQGVFTRQGLGPAWESQRIIQGGCARGLPGQQPSRVGGLADQAPPMRGLGCRRSRQAWRSGGGPVRGRRCLRARSQLGPLLTCALRPGGSGGRALGPPVTGNPGGGREISFVCVFLLNCKIYIT